MSEPTSRRSFLQAAGLGAAALGLTGAAPLPPKPIQGFEEAPVDPNASKAWRPVSDRKLRVGIVGYGFCRFGAAFGFQDHPNVEVAAVSDLFPDRCAGLAKACRCEKTYPSLEEMVKDDSLEAIFCATDAPRLLRHATGRRSSGAEQDSPRRRRPPIGLTGRSAAEGAAVPPRARPLMVILIVRPTHRDKGRPVIVTRTDQHRVSVDPRPLTGLSEVVVGPDHQLEFVR